MAVKERIGSDWKGWVWNGLAVVERIGSERSGGVWQVSNKNRRLR